MTDPLTRERVEEIRKEADKAAATDYMTVACKPTALIALCDTFLALENARAENARLREALKPIADVAPFLSSEWCGQGITQEAIRRARAALE